MVNILGAEMPKLGKIAININWVLILIIFLVFVIACIVIYVVYMRRTYKYKIICFENISGQGYQPTIRDRARILKIGDGGEELLFLQKKKVYRTAYGRKMGKNTYWFAIGQDGYWYNCVLGDLDAKMGKNTYWFAIGQDGYWYNCVLGDLDAKMGMLDIEPIDRDMRYMHVAVRKNITERYRKVAFMEKYGTILMSGIFVLVMLIGLGLLISKMGKIAGTINEGITIANQMMKYACGPTGLVNA